LQLNGLKLSQLYSQLHPGFLHKLPMVLDKSRFAVAVVRCYQTAISVAAQLSAPLPWVLAVDKVVPVTATEAAKDE